MDPLSITASVLAVAEVVLGTLKVLQIAHDAPKEIESLSKSVADFSIVLKTIDRASRRPGLSSVAVNDGLLAVRHLLGNAKAKFLDLQDILDRKFSANQSNIKSSISRFIWIKEKKRVKQLIAELQVLKIDILSVWGPIISQDISQVLLTLEKLSVDSARIVAPETLESDSQRDSNSLFCTTPYHSSSLRPRKPRLAIDQQSDTSSATTLVGDTARDDLAICASPISIMGWTNVQKEKAEQSLLPVHGRQVALQHQAPSKRVITTPSILQNLLGFLCLVYLHGQHRRPCRCLKMCNCMTNTSLTMTFQFPHWLLSYALTILYTFSNRMGPEFLLRVPKVRPANSELFHFACTGNLEGMRSLFRHGLASPFDIEYGTGLTALHKAVDWRQFDIIDLLRAEGADPFQGDYQGWTPLEAMSQLAFTSNNVLCQTYTSLLYKLQTDVLDALQFTELHRFIVGIAKGNILEQLVLNPNTVNQPDSGGQTPLFWAVTRGDATAVSTLLNYGADPNHSNKLQETALNWAIEASDSSCTTLLLSHGAQPTVRSVFGTTPLHYAAWTESSSSTPHVDALLHFGADPNARNNRGLTPLHYAVPNSSTTAMAKILDAGADIESTDEEGLTPLLEATRNNSVEAMLFLLKKGADPSARTNKGTSVAHILAEQGTIASMQELASNSQGLMSQVDFCAKDLREQTPRKLLLQRRDRETGLLEAYEELAKSVNYTERCETTTIIEVNADRKIDLCHSPVAAKNEDIVVAVAEMAVEV